jgi:hypothetical protein
MNFFEAHGNPKAKEVVQVRTMFIEKDSYGTNRLIVVDENMQQWVVSSKTGTKIFTSKSLLNSRL